MAPPDVLDDLRRRWRRVTATRVGRIGAWVVGLFLAWRLGEAVLADGAPYPIVLQGVVFGTVNALLAIGLILTYRTNRIINFAYAAMGGVGGVLAVHLFLYWHWNYFLAAGAGVVVGLVIGGVTEVFIIRRFRNSSRLVLTVATIGLAQILGGIQLYIPQWFNSTQGGLEGAFKTPLTFGVNLDPIRFTGDHMLIVAAVPPIMAALAWFLLRTDAGVAVRAAAENRDRAMLLGIPIQRLTTLVWILVGGLASLTFILKAPFGGAVSTALSNPTTALLPALAAAVLARMESLPRAFAAGIGMGIVSEIVFWNTGKASTIDVAFLIVILAGLLLQKDVLSRAEVAGESTWSMADVVRRVPVELRQLPEIRAFKIGALILGAMVFVFVPRGWEVADQILASTALIWAIIAVSLVVLTGWGGNISLGQFAIVGVGGVVAGNLIVNYNIDLFVVLALAGAAGGLTALLIGLPALRIRGLFLAVTTLAFAVALDSYFLNPDNFSGVIQTTIRRPTLFQRWPLEEYIDFYYLCLVFFVVTILIANRVRKTRSGRVLIATKDNDRAAAAAAVPTTTVRLTGFVFSGIIAGVAGGLYVVLIGGIGQGQYRPADSLEVFSMAVIGGLGSIGGVISGVFLFRWLQTVLSGDLKLIVTGAGLLFVLMIIPGGIAQVAMNVRDRALRRLAKNRGIYVPSLLEDKRLVSGEEALADEAPDETGVIAGALGDSAEEGAQPERQRPVRARAGSR